MAHELEMINGEAQMVYSGKAPWHKLGTKVDENLTPQEFQVAAGLDWEVKKFNLFTRVGNTSIKTDKKALVRTSDNKVMDIVSDAWNPVQNSEAFEFFNEFIDQGNMKMHTAGSLKEGQVIWALAKVEDSFTVFGDDKIDSYLLFTNQHKYGSSVDIRFTPVRVVCNNTLTFSLSDSSANFTKVNHTRAFDGEMVKNMMGISHEKLEKYKEMALFLGSKMTTEETLDNYLREVFPTHAKSEKKVHKLSRTAATVKDLIDTQPGAEFAQGSWWACLNSVTYATDHVLGHNDDSRLYSAWYGPNSSKKVIATKKAIEYAETA